MEGRLRYIFFDFPLESIHKNALKASEASRCAGEQGKYWEMHDQLFANSTALEMIDLARYAADSQFGSNKISGMSWIVENIRMKSTKIS